MNDFNMTPQQMRAFADLTLQINAPDFVDTFDNEGAESAAYLESIEPKAQIPPVPAVPVKSKEQIALDKFKANMRKLHPNKPV